MSEIELTQEQANYVQDLLWRELQDDNIEGEERIRLEALVKPILEKLNGA